MKQTLLVLAFFLSCAPTPIPAQWLYGQDAALISAEGAVTLKDAKGVSRVGEIGMEVAPGGMVSTGWDSKAGIRFFDGSVLEVKSNTQLRIQSLAHPTDQQKMIRFNLLAGLVEATVRKLMTSSSLFEIEAGGVVCGVRGTKFSVAYDPSLDRVHVLVVEGTVYAKSDGSIFLINADGEMEFIHGHPSASLQEKQKFAVPRTGERLADLKVQPDLAASAALNGEEALSASLRDLDAQFMAGLSLNGSSPGLNAAPGGMVLSNTSLALTGSLSLVGLRGSLPVKLPGLPVKLPGLP